MSIERQLPQFPVDVPGTPAASVSHVYLRRALLVGLTLVVYCLAFMNPEYADLLSEHHYPRNS